MELKPYGDPDNYCGIAISSCLSKLFTSLLSTHLEEYMVAHDLWNTNQCGFMKEHRTEDNIFVLHTIFQKYATKQKRKVYLALVDFSKYFDSLTRHFLYYKLLKLGISGHFYHIIK